MLHQLAMSDAALAVAFVGTCYDQSRLAEYFSISSVTASPGDIGLTAIHSMALIDAAIDAENADVVAERLAEVA
jgi:hypothetical protein